MKTNCFSLSLCSALALLAVTSAGCSEKAQLPDVAALNSKDKGAPSGSTSAAAVLPPVKWVDIKDCSYELRASFFTGLKSLHSQLDQQVEELRIKRVTLQPSVNTSNWDFAMKEMEDSRTSLKSAGEDLSKAGSDTWAQQKDRVSLAWVRTQDAYAKVKASVTQ